MRVIANNFEALRQLRSHKFARHSRVVTDDMQRPEGRLIQEALRASGLSARRASELMPISDSRLRHIIRGYQPVGQGQRISVVAPADTLADIALALDVTPEQMLRAGRRDAADLMTRRLDLEGASEGEMPFGVNRRTWVRHVTHFSEIQEWASRGLLDGRSAPDGVLRYIADEQLVAEISLRMAGPRRVQPSEATHLDDSDRHLIARTMTRLADHQPVPRRDLEDTWRLFQTWGVPEAYTEDLESPFVLRALVEGKVPEDWLSEASDEVPAAVAAHEEEGSIAGEQEESDTP